MIDGVMIYCHLVVQAFVHLDKLITSDLGVVIENIKVSIHDINAVFIFECHIDELFMNTIRYQHEMIALDAFLKECLQ